MKKLYALLLLTALLFIGIGLATQVRADVIDYADTATITVQSTDINVYNVLMAEGYYNIEIYYIGLNADPSHTFFYNGDETYTLDDWLFNYGEMQLDFTSDYIKIYNIMIWNNEFNFEFYDSQSVSINTTSQTWNTSNIHITAVSDVPDDVIPPTFTYSTATVNSPYNALITVATVKAQLSVTDDVDGNITSNIVIESDGYTSVTPKVVGTSYPVVFSATDSGGNKAYLTVYIKVVDTVKPTLTYSGTTYTNGQTITLPSWYNESPETAKLTLEEIKALFIYNDGYYASNLLTVSATVPNPAYKDTAGSYSITVIVTDPSLNVSTYTVNVNVLTNSTPVITGSATQTIEATSFNYAAILASYTASDTEDGSLTVVRDASSTWNHLANPQVLGTFTLVLKATDQYGRSGTKTVSITVRDTTLPIFKIGGTAYTTYAMNLNQSNTGALATLIGSIVITDAFYGTITSSKVVSVYPSFATPGLKTMTVTCADASGNSSTLTLNITLIDDIAPVINGAIKIVKGSTASLNITQISAQITATDNVDGSIVLALISDGYTGHSSQIGSYPVSYTATDSAGNVSSRTITVWVVDNVAPVWIVNGYFIPLSINQTVTREELITLLEGAGMINTELSYTLTFVTDEYTGSEEDSGLYDVTMLITYSDGSQDTVTVSLDVPESTIVIDDPSMISLSTILKYGASTAAVMIVLAVGVLLINKTKKHRKNKI